MRRLLAFLTPLALLLTACGASEPPAAKPTPSPESEQIVLVETSVSCETLIGDDGGLITRSGEFLGGVTELSAENLEKAEGFSEDFGELLRAADEELQEPIAIMQDELDGLIAAIKNNTDYQLVLKDFASAGQELIDTCSGVMTSPTAAATPAPTPTPTEDESVARGSTELEVVASEFGNEGYTLDFDWAIADPGQAEIVSVEGGALGSRDLSLVFDSAMQFTNTTEGSRTFNFHDEGGVSIVLRYPNGSPVCDYALNRAATDESCYVDTWDGTIVGIRFSDFPSLNEIIEGEATDQVQTTHELTLYDVPEAEEDQISEALLNYEQVTMYMHYGDTTDEFKSNCDQAALESMEYASIYLAIGAIGAVRCSE
ncbi:MULTISPECIES: hypothetical protein [unclassified Arthrobacter]|uniref:hypothetical protein n=1 Tax=unclassified Arthrobacter TaxID=235627 RepID=UPI0014927708|nr:MULTISPECIES: hypothetical protein [unclassified Arthrobacter]MBE0010540.1 hypothetical protein [Arthrobacter sp. AET 35A]NOJ64349.1 hypothetical protein [Arthrobacter sp. 147(2020)]